MFIFFLLLFFDFLYVFLMILWRIIPHCDLRILDSRAKTGGGGLLGEGLFSFCFMMDGIML